MHAFSQGVQKLQVHAFGLARESTDSRAFLYWNATRLRENWPHAASGRAPRKLAARSSEGVWEDFVGFLVLVHAFSQDA